VRRYEFEGLIDFPDDHEAPDEDFMDFTAFCYGDKHQDFYLRVRPGTIGEIEIKEIEK